MVLKGGTLGFIALNGSLVGREFQNLHLRMILVEIAIHLSKTTDDFFHQGLSGPILFVYTITR